MDLNLLSRLVTMCLFATAGLLVAQRMRVPVSPAIWVVLAIGVIAGMYIRFWLMSVLGFTILANWAIVSCCAGILAALTVRTIAQRRFQAGTP